MQGGRIETIACPRGKTSVIYVGAGSGNLWKSVNNGTTWKPIFDDESTCAIGSVTVAPSNADIVWVGTGERLMARSSYAGTGVFKSTDAGATWTHMGLADTHHVARVVIHPTNPDVVYVAAIGHLYSHNSQRGLFKTENGGKTWQKSLYVDDRTGVIDLAMHPRQPDTLYATTWNHARKAWGHVAYGKTCAIHKSTDGGATWTELQGGLPRGEGVGRIGVAIAPSNPDVVYAIVDCKNDAEGVYRSADAGVTWAKVNRTKIPAGYDFSLIRVSPDDENEVYTPGQRTMHSRDGGKTWRQVQGTLVHLLDHGSKVLHLDAHAMFIDPDDADHILLGNDGGIHVTYDRGATWLHWNNIPIGEFYAVGYDMAQPFRVFGGTQDNAALYGPHNHVPSDGGPDAWQHVYLDRWGGGDSYFTLVDPKNPNTVYYEHQFGALRRKDMATGKTKSIRPKGRLRCNWMSPFFLSHYDSNTIYFGTERLMKSTDRGNTWQPISPDLTTNPGPERRGNVPFGTTTTLSESILQKGLIYAGTDDGNVQVTRDDGAHWSQIDAALPRTWVSRVLASRHALGTVYVTLTGYREDNTASYVYRSLDYGVTWQPIVANLPMESVNVIAEDPKDPRLLFLGTDLGCYVSIDGGKRWESLCHGLPTTPVHDLFVHPRDRKLVIGTHGRSVYVLDVAPIAAAAR